jgi:hypothetical protein
VLQYLPLLSNPQDSHFIENTHKTMEMSKINKLW